MRKYLLPILLINFWGCEDTKISESDPINPLVGNWTLASIFVTVYSTPSLFNPSAQTISFAPDTVNYGTMILNEDATYSWQPSFFFYYIQGHLPDSLFVHNGEGDDSNLGTWSTEDSILTYVENGKSHSWTYSISNSNNLSMSIEYPADDVLEYATLSEYNWIRAE